MRNLKLNFWGMYEDCLVDVFSFHLFDWLVGFKCILQESHVVLYVWNDEQLDDGSAHSGETLDGTIVSGERLCGVHESHQ